MIAGFYNLGIGNVQGMHDDVEDARCWAVETGLADPRRIAIIGLSWGGYLALGGATKVAASPARQSHPARRGGERATAAAAAAAAAGHGRYAAVVGVVPLVSVGACNTSAAFRSDPLVTQCTHGKGSKLRHGRTPAP